MYKVVRFPWNHPDKTSLGKKVTWDEQIIGSQDGLFSMDSKRMELMQAIDK